MARTDSTSRDETLAGEVAGVVFASPESGFGVVELTGAGEAEGARAAGPLADLVPGQPVRLSGQWTEHPVYGPTFRVQSYGLEHPQSMTGLVTFLSSDLFSGVGTKTAHLLTEHFGLELPEVIASTPDRIAAVPGISARQAQTVVEGWAEAGALAELVARLAAAGVSATVAQAVHRRFGVHAVSTVADDPYALLVVRGIGWAHVEKLAAQRSVPMDDPRRLEAGAWQALREGTRAAGHLALHDDELREHARRLLGVATEDVGTGVRLARERGRIVAETPPGLAQHVWYLPADLDAERGVTDELARLHAAASRVPVDRIATEADEDLTDEQTEAVRAALSSPVSVLTGGPGTGKTRTVCSLVGICAELDLRLALCAPTGRAAKRLEEVTGHAATTVHRLLESRPAPGAHGGFTFTYGPDRKLPHDVVVADEWSMADVQLAWALLQAVADGAHLVLVGDPDQLPSVGPGAVLRDLLAVAGSPTAVPIATHLAHVHRQAATSRIVTLAHEINAGSVPPLAGRDGDVFVVPEQPRGIAARVAAIVGERAPDFYGITSSDVQVLAPMYRGPAGVDALNVAIKERINPGAGRRAVAGFHEGDRVVQTRNDAELEVANGDIGEVVATDGRDRTLVVAFPYGTVSYSARDAEDLRPAWALTVHKSQGGEWPVVVLVLDGAHRHMLWRELVYTAVTRAQRGLLLVGDVRLLQRAATRTGSGVQQRRTFLGARLEAALAG